MKLLITGGCGFIGHHIIEHFLKTTDWEIATIDKLTYAANGLNRVRDINVFDNKRVSFFTYDISNAISPGIVDEIGDVDYILHLAAETHVDRSIADPLPFVITNVVGTYNMLEYAKIISGLRAFVYFSTDEVFGPAPVGVEYKEWDRYNCTNPYSATKAGAEELCLAYMNTYKVQGFITHCMNVFGERQHAEKYIPKCIRAIRDGQRLTIHGTPDGKESGSRFYIHARNVANAIDFLLTRFEQRQKYNIVGEREITNLELAKMVAMYMEQPLYYDIVDYHSSRPGHDLRYALDGTLLKEMGWSVPMSVDKSLQSTVRWTLDNEDWLIL